MSMHVVRRALLLGLYRCVILPPTLNHHPCLQLCESDKILPISRPFVLRCDVYFDTHGGT